MNTNEQFSNLLHAAFPTQPMPARFFWKENVPDDGYEFCGDLLKWLARREWTEIRMSDWAMIEHISISREHLEPATFLYYLPALLLGVAEESKYLEWALEAIISLKSFPSISVLRFALFLRSFAVPLCGLIRDLFGSRRQRH